MTCRSLSLVMGDCVKRSDEDREGRSRGSMHPSQSVWMTHWKQTSCDASVQVSNGVANSEKIYDIKNHHRVKETEFLPEVVESGKQLGEIRTRRFEILNETTRARDLGYVEKRCESSPLVVGAKLSTIGTSMSCIPFSAADEFSSREIHSQPESNPRNPTGEVKAHPFFRESGFPVAKPLQENFPGSASDIVSYRSNHGNIRFGSGQRAIVEAPLLSSNDHKNFENALTPYVRQNITTLLPSDPSTSHLPEISNDHLKLQNFSGLRQLQLPHHRHTPEKLNHANYSQRKLPHSVFDVETMKMCTNVDSVVALPGGFPGFSQTTRSFLITEKTNGKGKEVINNFGNAFLDLQTPSPFFRSSQQGVKIHSLDSSADSEGKENTEDNIASKAILKNESSADTATMDMDAFKEKDCVSGVNVSPSNKVSSPFTFSEGNTMKSKPSKFLIDSCGTKSGREYNKTMLPDMNVEFCASSPEGDSKDSAEPSYSKTQSLDMDLLLGNAEQTNSDNSHAEPTHNDNSHSKPTNNDNSPKPDPSERWIKRLKVSTSDSLGVGTKISNLEDVSHKKATISEPKEENSHGDGLTEQDNGKTLSRSKELSSVSIGKSKDMLLSQAWIQRWLRGDRAGTPPTPKEGEVALLDETQSSKRTSNDFQQKHLPSIAAMALLGKAMNGFQPCQIEKKGPFIFWNTKEV